jgi:hypothetical protein
VNARQIGYVLIALIVLGVVGIVARLLVTETWLPELTGVSALTEQTIDKIVIRDQEFETTIVRSEDGLWWRGPYPVVPLKLQEMWEITAKFNGAELISINSINHRDMGVAPENTTFVEFYKDDILVEEFLIGDKIYSPIEEEEAIHTPWTVEVGLCYIRRHGIDETYGVVCETPERFAADPRFWSEPIILRIPRDEVEAVTFRSSTDSFALQVDRSVWYLLGSAGREETNSDAVQAFLGELELMVTSEFPTDEEIKDLDFSTPNYELGVRTRIGATEKSVLLLMLAKEDDGYYVKDADEEWVHFLDAETSSNLLVSRDFLLTGSTSTDAVATSTEPVIATSTDATGG